MAAAPSQAQRSSSATASSTSKSPGSAGHVGGRAGELTHVVYQRACGGGRESMEEYLRGWMDDGRAQSCTLPHARVDAHAKCTKRIPLLHSTVPFL